MINASPAGNFVALARRNGSHFASPSLRNTLQPRQLPFQSEAKSSEFRLAKK
jgi:hypothetical protein